MTLQPDEYAYIFQVSDLLVRVRYPAFHLQHMDNLTMEEIRPGFLYRVPQAIFLKTKFLYFYHLKGLH